MVEQSVFTAYLDPGTQSYRWECGESVPGLADGCDLRSGLRRLTAAGWELVSATSRSVDTVGRLTSEYALTCRRVSRM